jgi:alpha-galactosidase
MLQVGRGMSYEEDKTHFSMWCMLNSPLLAGNDLRNMPRQTVEILTNKEVIALNQDSGYMQARSILKDNDIEVWMKQLENSSKKKAIAILNRGEEEKVFTISAQKLGISNKSKLRDLWLHKDLGTIGKVQKITIPKHGIVVLKIN